MKSAQKQRITTDLIFVIIGILGIAAAFGRLGNDIDYLPTDLRSQPWFDPVVFWIQFAIGAFFLLVGAVRLVQEYRRLH